MPSETASTVTRTLDPHTAVISWLRRCAAECRWHHSGTGAEILRAAVCDGRAPRIRPRDFSEMT